MAKFDPTKDHGIVSGGGPERFFQNGLYFDALGNEIPGQVKAAKPAKAKAEAPVETLADDQVAQQLTEEFKE